METWKLLLITLLSAVVLGCVIGIVTGKQLLKRARGNHKPLLSTKERIIYALCMMAGGACIAAGLYFIPQNSGADGGMVDSGMMEDGLAVNEAVNDNDAATDEALVTGDGEAAGDTIADDITGDADAENTAANDEVIYTPEAQTEVAVARAVG